MKPRLDTFAFAVRYAFGHTYFDRCGQTLVDLQRGDEGWVPGDATPNSGTVDHFALDARLVFDAQQMTFAVNSVKELSAQIHAASLAWRIVRENLGLTELVRVGVRFHWLVSADAIDQAESLLRKSPAQIELPEPLKRYSPTRRSMVVVLRDDDHVEYRVALQTIIRAQGTPVSALVTAEPRNLPKHQRQARKELMKLRAQYDANPQYAVHLDVDCAVFDPPSVDPVKFIQERMATATRDFLPLLEFKS